MSNDVDEAIGAVCDRAVADVRSAVKQAEKLGRLLRERESRDRLKYIRRQLKKLRREPGTPLRSISWLAGELGVSRQMLYEVLREARRSADIEDRLTEMFPGVPEWPPSGYRGSFAGAVPISELTKTSSTSPS